MPEYAHLPLLLTTDRKKLSKRHNHASVEYYKTEAGVLPAALANFVAMLGWSPHGAWAVLMVVGRFGVGAKCCLFPGGPFAILPRFSF